MRVFPDVIALSRLTLKVAPNFASVVADGRDDNVVLKAACRDAVILLLLLLLWLCPTPAVLDAGLFMLARVIMLLLLATPLEAMLVTDIKHLGCARISSLLALAALPGVLAPDTPRLFTRWYSIPLPPKPPVGIRSVRRRWAVGWVAARESGDVSSPAHKTIVLVS